MVQHFSKFKFRLKSYFLRNNECILQLISNNFGGEKKNHGYHEKIQ